jgi:predicted phage tail protein
MLTDCYLYGKLGKMYGHHWRLDVNSPAQFVRAMIALRPGFAQTVLTMKDVDFGVRVGERQVGEDALTWPANGKSISITPVLRGSGGKGFSIGELILGVALIVVGFAAQAYLGPFATSVILLGVGLTLGGVAALLAPSPPTADSQRDPHKPSYQFNGPINTIEEGQPVPILYGGPLWIGSAVVDAGIFSVNTSTIVSGTTIGPSDSDTGPGNAATPIGEFNL